MNIEKIILPALTRITTYIAIIIAFIGLTACSTMPNLSSLFPQQSAAVPHNDIWQGNANEVWNQLQPLSDAKLVSLRNQAADATQRGWLDLALISKRQSTNTSQLVSSLINWRNQYGSHPANSIFPDNQALTDLIATQPPHQIALLIPQRGIYAASGQSVREGFLNAYYAHLARVGSQNIKFYDTTVEPRRIAAIYQQAIAEGADFVIGPLIKDDVQQLLNSASFNTKTLALNYTDRSLPANFYEFGLSPDDEATQLANQAQQAHKSRAIIIAPQTAWGKRMTAAFSNRWHALGGRTIDSWYFAKQADYNQDIARLMHIDLQTDKALTAQKSDRDALEKQRRQDFDVVILFAQPDEGRSIVPLLRYYYVTNVPIYSTSAIYSGTPNAVKDVDLNGVIICDIPWSRGGSPDRLYAVGKDAYLLSLLLQRLTVLPNFPIYGTTGALTLGSNQQIRRRLPCVPVRNGLI